MFIVHNSLRLVRIHSMGENAGTLAPRPRLPASWLSAASGSWDAAAAAAGSQQRGVVSGEVGGPEGRRVILSGTSGGAVSVEVGPPHVVVELAFTNSVRFLQPGLLLQVRCMSGLLLQVRCMSGLLLHISQNLNLKGLVYESNCGRIL